MRAELLSSPIVTMLHLILDSASMSSNQQRVAAMAALALSRLVTDRIILFFFENQRIVAQ